MGCSVADFGCNFVDELIGSKGLALAIAYVLFFIYANKSKMGFETTLWLFLFVGPLFAFFITGSLLAVILAAIATGVALGLTHLKLSGNR